MGIDVNLYAEGDVTDEQLAAANDYLTKRCDIADDWDKSGQVLVREDRDWYDRPRVTLKTFVRYYGECYERGPWPAIYGAIRLMQTCLPDCRIFYGGDTSDEGLEVDDEYLTEMWAHYLGPNGDDYREFHRRREAERQAASKLTTVPTSANVRPIRS